MSYKYFLLGLLGFFWANVQAYSVSEIAITPLGSTSLISVGQTSEIARFRFTNEGRKYLSLERIDFKNYGTLNLKESFSSIEVYNNHNLVGHSARIDRKTVTILFDETLIGPGDSLILTIKGNLQYARYNKTIQLGIRDPEDVLAKEMTTGMYAECEDCDNVKMKVYRTKAGSISISGGSYYRPSRYYGSRNYRYSSSRYTPSYTTKNQYSSINSNYLQRSYNPGAKGVVFLSTSLRSKVDIAVDGMFVSLSGNAKAKDKNSNSIDNEVLDFEETFRDFRLYINGYEVDSTNNFDHKNGETGLLFDSSFEIPANAQIVVSGRINSQADDGDSLILKIGSQSLISPEYLQSGNSISSSNIHGGFTTNRRQVETKPRLQIYKIND